jgi:hypothetical protein
MLVWFVCHYWVPLKNEESSQASIVIYYIESGHLTSPTTNGVVSLGSCNKQSRLAPSHGASVFTIEPHWVQAVKDCFYPFVAGQSIFVSRDFWNMFSLRFITERKLEAVKRACLSWNSFFHDFLLQITFLSPRNYNT